MIVTARTKFEILPGTPRRPSKLVAAGFKGLLGTVVRAEITNDGWLECDIEIDDRTRLASLLRDDSVEGLSA